MFLEVKRKMKREIRCYETDCEYKRVRVRVRVRAYVRACSLEREKEKK